MLVSYNWLKQYISKLPTPNKLADLLTMHSFEVENLEKNKNDWILDIDVLSNRASDCLSYMGIAREISALTGNKISLPKNEIKEINQKNNIGIDIKHKELCSRYTARTIKDLKVKESPNWLKKRIESIGQQSINNIVDLANYVMLETGQPLHVFDLDKINGNKIIIRKAKKGEEIVSLDNQKYKLDNNMLVIADQKHALAIAGIKGGKKAEVDNNTKNIILESANFNLNSIYKTSRKLGLRTEASLRFEHGLDPNLTVKAINRLGQLISKTANGKINKEIADAYSKQIKPKKVSVKLSKINNILGTELTKTQVSKIFKSLGFNVKDSRAGKTKDIKFIVKIPTYRLDIEKSEDLIEEVGRIYGYHNIQPKPLLAELIFVTPSDSLKVKAKTKNILKSLNFAEVYNFSFIGEKDLEKLKIDPKNYIELYNPLSLDLKYLRKNLIVNLLKNTYHNSKHFKQIKLFELGKVYSRPDKPKEQMMLAGLISGKDKEKNLFFELKGLVDGLFDKLGISDCWYNDFKAEPEWSEKKIWNPLTSAEIKSGNKELGFLGGIKSQVLSKFNIKNPTVAFNINFEILSQLVNQEIIYTHPSKYPAVIRDIAILVNLGDRVADVLNVINDAGGKLIKDIDLFDIYEGRNLPERKKNLAFHIIYQSNNRTLTDQEVNKLHNKIIKQITKKGWEVRQ